jgi:hypothetical protein
MNGRKERNGGRVMEGDGGGRRSRRKGRKLRCFVSSLLPTSCLHCSEKDTSILNDIPIYCS